MPAKKKIEPKDDDVYRVKHISRSAWEDGKSGLPGLPPDMGAPPTQAFDDVAADMAMTGEIPLELIRDMLRRQEAEVAARRAAQSTAQKANFGMIRPEDIVSRAEFAEETPTRNEIEAAKQELRAMKAKSRLPEPAKPEKPAKPAKPKPVRSAKPTAQPKPKPVKAAVEVKKEKPKGENVKTKEVKKDMNVKEAKKAEPVKKETKTPWIEWVVNTLRLYFIAEGKQEKQKQAPDFWHDDKPLYQLPVGGVFNYFYRSIYYFGLRFARPVMHFWRHSKPYLLHPVLALWHLWRAMILALHHVTLGRVQRAFAHAKAVHARRSAQRGEVRGFAAAQALFRDYNRLIRVAGNIAMPVAAMLLLLLVVQFEFGQTYALAVTFNDSHVGYVASESVFLQAQAAANDHMQPLAVSLEENGRTQADAVEENMQAFAQFQLTRVRPELLTPADILTDRLLEHSPNEMASGVGVFIGDENGDNSRLVATIRNSTDADSVLKSIITEQTAKQNIDVRPADTVSFVQNIDIVPGFYPRNQMIDAQELLRRIGGTRQGEQVAVFEEGDRDLITFANRNGLTFVELQQLNPFVVGNETRIQFGTEFVVSQEIGYLQVKVIRTETRRAEVAYENVDVDNFNLFQGEIRIRVRGVPGEDEITERVTYINGVRHGNAEEISRRRVREPVAQRREIGRRSTRVTLPSGQVININPSAQGFVWPVPDCRRISSPFGMRNGRMHNGIDIADGNTNGKVVVAAKAGTIEFVRHVDAYGLQIMIDHGNGVKTRYAHLMTGSVSVSAGQRVETGQPIARVGSTGRSTGPHLHFEVIVDGRPQNPRNYVSP